MSAGKIVNVLFLDTRWIVSKTILCTEQLYYSIIDAGTAKNKRKIDMSSSKKVSTGVE
jgi:hypothetical protein